MRYLILKPAEATDPRSLKLASSLELHRHLPPYVECENERAAVQQVRRLLPGAVPLVFPIEVGSGQTILLGFVDDDHQRRVIDREMPIKFSLFVQPVPEDERDRKVLKNGGGTFTRELWKVAPEKPDLYKRTSVEVRATDAEVPIFTDALVGRDQKGRLVMFVEALGVAFSVHFDNKTLQLTELPPELEDEAATPTLAMPHKPTEATISEPSTDRAPRTVTPPGCRPLDLWKS